MKKILLSTLIVVSLGASVVSARDVNRKVDRLFNKVDINNDNLISPTEFFATQSGRSSQVLALHRFEYADVNHDNMLDLTEFRACRGGKTGGKPSKSREFELADEDHDNRLDPTEFANTLRQRMAFSKVLKKFQRKDRNNDGELTPFEFGVRNISI